MKRVRASLLVLVLSVCAYAGDMDNGVAGPPPPPPTSARAGEIQYPSASLIEAALALLSIVLP